MADDDINRVADAADDVPFMAFVPRITGPDRAEIERLATQQPLTDDAVSQLQAMVENHEQKRAEIKALYPRRRAGHIHLGHAELHQLLGIHDGLRITGFYADPRLHQLVIVVEGDDLREVPEGCEPRILAGRWDYTHVELPTGEHDETEVLIYGRLDWWSD